MVFAVLLHFTRSAAASTPSGINAEAAGLPGVKVARTKFWLFVVTGAMSALAGVYWTLRFGSARGDNARRGASSRHRGGAARRRLHLRRPGALLGVIAGVAAHRRPRNALQLLRLPTR